MGHTGRPIAGEVAIDETRPSGNLGWTCFPSLPIDFLFVDILHYSYTLGTWKKKIKKIENTFSQHSVKYYTGCPLNNVFVYLSSHFIRLRCDKILWYDMLYSTSVYMSSYTSSFAR